VLITSTPQPTMFWIPHIFVFDRSTPHQKKNLLENLTKLRHTYSTTPIQSVRLNQHGQGKENPGGGRGG
jgi:hypothetical protein